MKTIACTHQRHRRFFTEILVIRGIDFIFSTPLVICFLRYSAFSLWGCFYEPVSAASRQTSFLGFCGRRSCGGHHAGPQDHDCCIQGCVDFIALGKIDQRAGAAGNFANAGDEAHDIQTCAHNVAAPALPPCSPQPTPPCPVRRPAPAACRSGRIGTSRCWVLRLRPECWPVAQNFPAHGLPWKGRLARMRPVGCISGRVMEFLDHKDKLLEHWTSDFFLRKRSPRRHFLRRCSIEIHRWRIYHLDLLEDQICMISAMHRRVAL